MGQVASPAGLQGSDFSVDCGKSALLKSVQEVSPATVSNFKSPVPIYILYDAASIPSPAQGITSKLLLKFLRTTAEENRALSLVVSTDQGLQVIHEMSTESKVLYAALDRLDLGQAPVTSSRSEFDSKVNEEAARLQQLTRLLSNARFRAYTPPAFQQLQTLEQVGEMLRRSPKRKLLVWMTGSFPLTIDSDELLYRNSAVSREPNLTKMTVAYEKAISSLNLSRISAYPIRIPVRVANGDTTGYGLAELARNTGGRYLGELDEIDFPVAVAELSKEPQPYYLLTFDTFVRKESWVGCKIKTNRREIQLWAPKGFFFEP